MARKMNRKELLDVIKWAACEGGTSLNLYGRGIFKLPDEIGQLTNLQELYLSRSQLASLPASIGRLSNLRKLNFGDNQLASLRSGILALHAFLREEDPNQERLGLHRVATYTGDFLWLCQKHYEDWQPKIPDKIE